jgi:nucleoside-diphosphate-sugar epimerase
MESPDAAGQRYLIADVDQWATMEIADIAREAFPELAGNIPSVYSDKDFDGSAMKPSVVNAKVCKLLGVEALTPVKQTVTDAVQSFLDRGLVKADK